MVTLKLRVVAVREVVATAGESGLVFVTVLLAVVLAASVASRALCFHVLRLSAPAASLFSISLCRSLCLAAVLLSRKRGPLFAGPCSAALVGVDLVVFLSARSR